MDGSHGRAESPSRRARRCLGRRGGLLLRLLARLLLVKTDGSTRSGVREEHKFRLLERAFASADSASLPSSWFRHRVHQAQAKTASCAGKCDATTRSRLVSSPPRRAPLPRAARLSASRHKNQHATHRLPRPLGQPLGRQGLPLRSYACVKSAVPCLKAQSACGDTGRAARALGLEGSAFHCVPHKVKATRVRRATQRHQRGDAPRQPWPP